LVQGLEALAEPGGLGLGRVEVRHGHHEAHLRQQVPLGVLQRPDLPLPGQGVALERGDLVVDGVHLGEEDLGLGLRGYARRGCPQLGLGPEVVHLILEQGNLAPVNVRTKL
jgi:hypothetical protein